VFVYDLVIILSCQFDCYLIAPPVSPTIIYNFFKLELNNDIIQQCRRRGDQNITVILKYTIYFIYIVYTQTVSDYYTSL